MNMKTILNKFLKLFGLPTFMPKSSNVTLIAEIGKKNLRANQIMLLKNKLAICSYDNDSRHNSWIYVVDKKGGNPSCVYSSDKKETIGMSNSLAKINGRKVYIMPAEDAKCDKVIAIDYETGSVTTTPYNAPYRYSEVADGSVAYFADKGKGCFFDFATGKTLDKNLPNKCIVFGMIKDGSDYVCACDDGGLQSSDGWRITDYVSDVNFVGKKIVAFLREGKVRLLNGKKLGKEICHTNLKARRSCQDSSNALCYWTTHGPQQLWVTNGSDAKKLADFGGDIVKEAWKEGSCFSSAVVVEDSKTAYVVSSKAGNAGWRLYKVDIKW